MSTFLLLHWLSYALIALSQNSGVGPLKDQLTPNSTCLLRPSEYCFADDSDIFMYGWWAVNDEVGFPYFRLFDKSSDEVYSTPTVTATVVTVINTVMNTTSRHTVMPTNWVPPLTNAEGTQIRILTYSSWGVEYTTTIAFPSVFIDWPSLHAYRANFYDPASTTSCTPGFTTITASITGPTPQPTLGDGYPKSNKTLSNPQQLLDPRGLMATPMTIQIPNWTLFSKYHTLFPEHPEFSCVFEGGWGPDWGGFVSSWAIAAATSYTG